MNSLFNRKQAASTQAPAVKAARSQVTTGKTAKSSSQYIDTFNRARKPEGTLKSQFGRQFNERTHTGKVRGKAATKGNIVRIQQPRYVAIGSGLTRSHAFQQKHQRYYGEGIF